MEIFRSSYRLKKEDEVKYRALASYYGKSKVTFIADLINEKYEELCKDEEIKKMLDFLYKNIEKNLGDDE